MSEKGVNRMTSDGQGGYLDLAVKVKWRTEEIKKL